MNAYEKNLEQEMEVEEGEKENLEQEMKMEEVKRTSARGGGQHKREVRSGNGESVPVNAHSRTATADRLLDPHGAPPLSLGEVAGVTISAAARVGRRVAACHLLMRPLPAPHDVACAKLERQGCRPTTPMAAARADVLLRTASSAPPAVVALSGRPAVFKLG
jgi:hypothetical protein